MLIKQYLIKYIYLFEHKGGENIRKQLIPKKTKTFLLFTPYKLQQYSFVLARFPRHPMM